MHKAELWALQVQRGEIPANKYVIKTVEQYFYRRENYLDLGYVFKEKKARAACSFVPAICKHVDGELAGTPIDLPPWAYFIIWNIFGWYKADGTRLINTSFILVSRKNAKSTLAVIIGIIELILSGLKGVQVYSGATTHKQAMICIDIAREIVKQSKELKRYFRVYKKSINSDLLNSKFEPLTSKADTQDGFKPNVGIIDEYHAHPDDKIYNIIEGGMGSITNPLMFTISTAGFNKLGPCYRMREMCMKILDGILTDESVFSLIFEMDEGDDYEDPNNWIKCNPSLPYIPSLLPYLHRRLKKMENDPTQSVEVKTKNFNIWCDASKVWITSDMWRKRCIFNMDKVTSRQMSKLRDKRLKRFRGRLCYGAFDLSSIHDLTAFSLIFPPQRVDGKFELFTWFFIPKMTLTERVKRDKVMYNQWSSDGWMIETEGNVVDYDVIRRFISGYYVCDGVEMHDSNCIKDLYDMKSISYDPWNAQEFAPKLISDGLKMSKLTQTIGKLSPPTKQFKKMILNGDLLHDGNPCLAWNISNVEIQIDNNGNERPDKAKSREKIDGAMSGIIAVSEYMDKWIGIKSLNDFLPPEMDDEDLDVD